MVSQTWAKSRRITEGVTFRMESSLLEDLRKEADHREISLNTYANQIFKQHMEWHFGAAKAGWMPIQREVLKMIIERTSDEEVRALADHIATHQMQEVILMLRREYDFDSFLDVMEAWLRISQIPYNHKCDEDRHIFVIQHDLGKKWKIIPICLNSGILIENW